MEEAELPRGELFYIDFSPSIENVQEFIQKWKESIAECRENLADNLEHSEIRYRINMEHGNYYAAMNHLRRALDIKMSMINKKHCE